MRGYKNIECNELLYRKYVEIQLNNKKSFSEHILGSRRKLMIDGKPRATIKIDGALNLGELTNQKFATFLAVFTKELYRSFLNFPELFYLRIKFRGTAKNKNYKLYNELKPESSFYNIDLNSAYWQMAYRLGYISQQLFEKYDAEEYKHAKRYCISFLARQNKMTYNDCGKVREISCDIQVLKTIYDNIRYELYKCIAKVVSLCSDYIEYNIDGVTVLAIDVDRVMKAFDEMNLDYKLTKYTKIDNYQYQNGSTIRNFKTKTV